MGRPRRTLRTRLTLLYAIPFLASGAILLSVPILSINESSPAGGPAPAGPPRKPQGWPTTCSSPRPWRWPACCW